MNKTVVVYEEECRLRTFRNNPKTLLDFVDRLNTVLASIPEQHRASAALEFEHFYAGGKVPQPYFRISYARPETADEERVRLASDALALALKGT